MPLITKVTKLGALTRFIITHVYHNLGDSMELRCKDVGMNCDFEIKGASSEEEIMQMAAIHAKVAHNMDKIPPELAAKAKAAIKK